MKEDIQEKEEGKVEEIADTLHIMMPEGNLPIFLKLISIFTLVGGLSIIGSLFVDIGQPSSSVHSGFYLLRLLIGLFAVSTSYGLVKRQRWAMWLYGIIVCIGLILNPITALIPGLVFIYLFIIRRTLKPSLFDHLLAYLRAEIIAQIRQRNSWQ